MDKDFVKGETLKANRQRIVECASGNCYHLRRLTKIELAGLKGSLPDVSAIPIDDKEEAALAERMGARLNPADLMSLSERAVSIALVSPKVGPGDDEIEIEDVPAGDLAELARNVFDMCGMTRGAARKVAPLSDARAS